MGEAGKAVQKVEPNWEEEGYYVSLGINKSRRYHAMMREFYKRLHDWALTATAVGGSAAFVSLLPPNPNALLPRVLAGIVALASTLDLVFDFAKKADRHDGLCRRFSELAASLLEVSALPEEIRRAEAARIRIEADEPTERRIVELWAQNDECRSRGVEIDKLVPFSWVQRTWLMYLVRTWDEAGLEKRIHAQRSRLATAAAKSS